jgi:hypothetical protein
MLLPQDMVELVELHRLNPTLSMEINILTPLDFEMLDVKKINSTESFNHFPTSTT